MLQYLCFGVYMVPMKTKMVHSQKLPLLLPPNSYLLKFLWDGSFLYHCYRLAGMKMLKKFSQTEKWSAPNRTKGKGNLPLTNREVSPFPQIHLMSTSSRIFVENEYPVSEFSVIFGCFESLVLDKFCHVGNVADLENMIICIIWSISTISKKSYHYDFLW